MTIWMFTERIRRSASRSRPLSRAAPHVTRLSDEVRPDPSEAKLRTGDEIRWFNVHAEQLPVQRQVRGGSDPSPLLQRPSRKVDGANQAAAAAAWTPRPPVYTQITKFLYLVLFSGNLCLSDFKSCFMMNCWWKVFRPHARTFSKSDSSNYTNCKSSFMLVRFVFVKFCVAQTRTINLPMQFLCTSVKTGQRDQTKVKVYQCFYTKKTRNNIVFINSLDVLLKTNLCCSWLTFISWSHRKQERVR